MKRTIVILFTLLIPLTLMGSIFDHLPNWGMAKSQGLQAFDRAWRVNDKIQEDYNDGDWENLVQNLYIYNVNYPARLDTFKMCMYNPANGTWMPYVTSSYIYNPDQEYVHQMMIMLTYGGQAIPMRRATCTYDNQNRLTQMALDNYDNGSSTWIPGYWMKMIYTTNTNYWLCTYSPADDEDPEVWEKTAYEWDGQGRVIVETTQTSPDSVNWVYSVRTERTFHASDTSTGDSWISWFSHAIVIAMTIVEYNLDFRIAEETDQYWDNGWENESLNNYTYDAQNRLTEQLSKVWDNGWINHAKGELTYDANSNIHQVVSSDWNTDTWEINNRWTYNWGQTTANEDNELIAVPVLDIQSSPNPFSSGINIRINSKYPQPVSVSIFNAKGQKVRSYMTDSGSTVIWDGRDKDNLPVSNGIYFIKATTNGASTSRKIMKL